MLVNKRKLWGLTTVLVGALTAGALYGQAEGRVHQVFETKNRSKARLKSEDIKQEVHTKESYSSVIVVEIIVKTTNLTQKELEQLIKTDHFHLQALYKDDEVILSPKNESRINPKHKTKGIDAQLTYNIAMPEYMEWLK